MRPAPARPGTRASLIELLSGLYEQARSCGEVEYLRLHSAPAAIARHVEAFLLYRPFLPEQGDVLDWGCFHAPDACLIRALRPGVNLFGCDIVTSRPFAPFHEYARLRFETLADPVRLPYETGSFDAAVGSGVLEHAPMDLESLKELYRVLKPDAPLVLTYLPNRWSYTEFLSRRLGDRHHSRLYSRRSIRDLLLHHGFEPVCVRYHQFLPARRAPAIARRLDALNGLLERSWPTRVLCANLLAVARKRRQI